MGSCKIFAQANVWFKVRGYFEIGEAKNKNQINYFGKPIGQRCRPINRR